MVTFVEVFQLCEAGIKDLLCNNPNTKLPSIKVLFLLLLEKG